MEQFEYEVRTKMVLEYDGNGKTSKMMEASIILLPDKNVEYNYYFDANDMPTMEGHKIIMHTLVQGLLNNIHAAHQANIWDSAEQLRQIISELERGFVSVVTMKEGEYTSPKDDDISDKTIEMIADIVEIIEETLPHYVAFCEEHKQHGFKINKNIVEKAHGIIATFRK